MEEVIASVPVPKPNWYWTIDIAEGIYGKNHELDLDTTYSGFQSICSNMGMRLCTFEEYCPSED